MEWKAIDCEWDVKKWLMLFRLNSKQEQEFLFGIKWEKEHSTATFNFLIICFLSSVEIVKVIILKSTKKC